MTLPDPNSLTQQLPEATPLPGPGLPEASLSFCSDWVADNQDMHEKFGVNERVKKLDNEKFLTWVEFRLKFLEEELNEAKTAFAQLNEVHYSTTFDEVCATLEADGAPDAKILAAQAKNKLITNNAEDIVDAMVDLCVVAIGTLNAMNVDAYEAWDRVHTANMAKEVGIKASRPNPLGLPDLIKPAGWVGPDHSDNIGYLSRFLIPTEGTPE